MPQGEHVLLCVVHYCTVHTQSKSKAARPITEHRWSKSTAIVCGTDELFEIAAGETDMQQSYNSTRLVICFMATNQSIYATHSFRHRLGETRSRRIGLSCRSERAVLFDMT